MPNCLECGKKVEELSDDGICAECWGAKEKEQPNNVDEFLEQQRARNRANQKHRAFRREEDGV